MSYRAEISFKTLDAGEVYSFLQTFKNALARKFKEIAEDNFMWAPTIRYEHSYEGVKDDVKDNLDRAWARASVFTFRYFYLPKYNLLGVFSVPEAVKDIFDACCFFQNSCDQDYSFDEWNGVPAFEQIAAKWENATDEETKDHYVEKYGMWDEDKDFDYDYYRRTFAYKEIWGLCEPYLYNEEDVVYLSAFGHYENYLMHGFVQMCRNRYQKWLDELDGGKTDET